MFLLAMSLAMKHLEKLQDPNEILKQFGVIANDVASNQVSRKMLGS